MARPSARQIEAIRSFNRFYTRKIGVLRQGLLGSDLSLTEVRVLYELANRPAATATELTRDLEIDPGYLSRILHRFDARGWIRRRRARDDRRRSLVSLTPSGRRMFGPLDRRAANEIAAMIGGLSSSNRGRLVGAMRAIERTLSGNGAGPARFAIREPAPGEYGWVVERHGALYAQDYGWGERFEALVADVVASFMNHHDPKRERCWIVDVGGEPVGSVFCVAKSASVAKLRLLIVEPEARGLGIGSGLVDECIGFARARGYASMELWTQSVLVDARRIYERAGFELVERRRHRDFGVPVTGETWRLRL